MFGRARTMTADESALAEGPTAMDGFLSSSYPGAVPPRNRPEPPRAPLRKPSEVSWEVPPLELPMAPKKRSFSGSGTTIDEELAGLTLEKSSEDADEEEEDEPIMFSLDGGAAGAGDDEEEDHGDVQYHLAGFDDDLEPALTKGRGADDEDGMPSVAMAGARTWHPGIGSPVGMGSLKTCERSGSISPPLGASPILMSVLGLVAAQAGEAKIGAQANA